MVVPSTKLATQKRVVLTSKIEQIFTVIGITTWFLAIYFITQKKEWHFYS